MKLTAIQPTIEILKKYNLEEYEIDCGYSQELIINTQILRTAILPEDEEVLNKLGWQLENHHVKTDLLMLWC